MRLFGTFIVICTEDNIIFKFLEYEWTERTVVIYKRLLKYLIDTEKNQAAIPILVPTFKDCRSKDFIFFCEVSDIDQITHWRWMKLCEQILNTQSFLSRHLSLSWFVSKSREHSNQLSNSYQLLLIQTQCAISQKKNLSSTIVSQFTNVFRIAKFYFTGNWKKFVMLVVVG